MKFLLIALLALTSLGFLAESDAEARLFRGHVRAAIGRMFLRSADRAAARSGMGHGYHTARHAVRTFGMSASSGGCSSGGSMQMRSGW